MRDATRTLMKAITLVRAQGLRHRMEEPALFIRRRNILAMQMTPTWNEKDSHKARKKVLRKMDKLVGCVARHAKRYRMLLDQPWEQTEWTRSETDCVLRRLDGVLSQLPAARRQARERPADRRCLHELRARAHDGESAVVLPTMGGSVPLWAFTDILERPTIVVPYANANNRQHSPNEHLRLDHLYQGVLTTARLLHDLG